MISVFDPDGVGDLYADIVCKCCWTGCCTVTRPLFHYVSLAERRRMCQNNFENLIRTYNSSAGCRETETPAVCLPGYF